MADDDLRALERAAKTRPDDLAAGRAWARALGRAGDPREHDELARLSRLGDAGAEAELAAWNPWPSPGGCWSGPALERLGSGWSVDLGPVVRLVGVGRRHLLVSEPGDGLVARGLDDLQVRWRRGPCSDVHTVLTGDLVVTHANHDQGPLMAWDAATGKELAAARLGSLRWVEPVAGARAIVFDGAGDGRLVLVDLRREAFGEVAWSRRVTLDPHVYHHAGGPWVLVNDRVPSVLAVATGKRAWRPDEADQLWAADASGVLAGAGGQLVAFDPSERVVRWRFAPPGPIDRFWLAFDARTVLAIVGRRGHDPGEMVAIARDNGAVRWRRPLDLHVSMALLPDGLYLSRAQRVGHKVLQPWVTLIDPLDGTVKDEQALPRAPLSSRIEVAPFPGGVMALCGSRLWIFDGREAPEPAAAEEPPARGTTSKSKKKRKLVAKSKKKKLTRRPDR